MFPSIAAVSSKGYKILISKRFTAEKAPNTNKRESPGKKGVITNPVSEKIIKKELDKRGFRNSLSKLLNICQCEE